MAHNDNVTRLYDQPRDYVERVTIPTPMFTADELLWSCFFSGLFGVLITCIAAWVFG